MGNMIQIPKNVDWSEVTELPLKTGGTATLSHKGQQVTVELHMENAKIKKQTYMIRWENDTQG